MSFIPVQNKTRKTLFRISIYSVLALLLLYFMNLETGRSRENDKANHAVSKSLSKAAHFSSTDFGITHQSGRYETIQPLFPSKLHEDKLLRSAIVDPYQQIILTQRLARFNHSTYTLTLSPLWHPSIPIAHRKLII